ncbi:Cyclic nucleotide-binding protein [Pseudocohnilembus persalinus]|uniref:Cyclic nucleotide-binding protein n=1 Tax=Pseudocohnilembus persalinus TaxID=266149 RepID=A0A0V0R9H5_PSEPJ|nr:Cyclic nucleotide-binding protein [Pseudocohnilembus persalinus]|eukprot:KRX11145.1 Cyclic nucleotide-binding protein [Pseudocohnilembus persalinus]
MEIKDKYTEQNLQSDNFKKPQKKNQISILAGHQNLDHIIDLLKKPPRVRTEYQINEIGREYYFIIEGEVEIRVNEEKQPEGNLSSFGELALLGNYKRTASIFCTKDSHFGYIDNFIFQRQVNAQKDQEIAETLTFFKQMPVFKNLSTFIRKIIFQNYQEQTYTFNRVVFNEGELLSSIFIIKEGQFVIIRDKKETFEEKIKKVQLEQNQNQFQKIIENQINEDEYKEFSYQTHFEVLKNNDKQNKIVSPALKKVNDQSQQFQNQDNYSNQNQTCQQQHQKMNAPHGKCIQVINKR